MFKNFWDISFNFQTSPRWNKDYFINSPVYNGYFLRRTPYYYFSINGSTDSRKKLYVNYLLGGAESPLPKGPLTGLAKLAYVIDSVQNFS
ncbi:MAG: DUF5916 domain-containing protein [Ferruginibacter sp.]